MSWPYPRLTCACQIAVALAGCRQAVVVEIASDRPIPQALDRMCVGVADDSQSGGQFGSNYALTTLPQTLRVKPGGADSALAWVRGDRGGVPVALAAAHLDFSDDVTLALDKCVVGPSTAPQIVGDPVGPPGALLAASEGQGGTVVIAATDGMTSIIDAQGHQLVASDGPAIAGNPLAIVAADLDGDCDDDFIVLTDGGPPQVFLRDHGAFVAGAMLDSTFGAVAVAAADVDGDGAIDLVLGGGATLELWLNDGAGNFTKSSTLAAGTHVTAVTAVALGDLTGDGVPDLIVGQSGAPLAAWIGAPGGSFSYNAGLVGALPLDVERLTMADADGDLVPDLAIAVKGAPMHLLLDSENLQDHSMVALPQPAPTAHAIAIGGWDDGCTPDLVIASDDGAPTLDGQATGVFAPSTNAPAATDVVLVDIDDNGALDAVFATANGVTWFGR